MDPVLMLPLYTTCELFRLLSLLSICCVCCSRHSPLVARCDQGASGENSATADVDPADPCTLQIRWPSASACSQRVRATCSSFSLIYARVGDQS